jgi:hypothetical protein
VEGRTEKGNNGRKEGRNGRKEFKERKEGIERMEGRKGGRKEPGGVEVRM